MATFTLTPDEPLAPVDTASRQLRLVSTSLAPPAEPPLQRAAKDDPPASAPCATCGAQVLHGVTAAGTAVTLDTQARTYVVVWPNGDAQPRLTPSMGYPGHVCHTKERELDQRGHLNRKLRF
jgi:hypothetical protein